MTGMRQPSPSDVLRCALLTALSIGLLAESAADDAHKKVQSQPVHLMADTRASAGRQGVVPLGGVMWDCRGSRCTSSSVASAVAAPLPVCQSLARAVGALRSFSVARRPLKLTELQSCNAVLPPESSAVRGTLPAVVPADSHVKRTPQHRERLVTADDFGTSSRSDPGLQVDRVEVKPRAHGATPPKKSLAKPTAPASQSGAVAPAPFSPVARRTPVLTIA